MLYAKSFYECSLQIYLFVHDFQRTYCMNWSLFGMNTFKRTSAYVEGNSCRGVESVHSYSNAALFAKAFALVCFVVFIYYSYLFWLNLCIYVGHGRAIGTAQWLLLLQKQQCLVLERTGFGSFCKNDISKRQTCGTHSTPLGVL